MKAACSYNLAVFSFFFYLFPPFTSEQMTINQPLIVKFSPAAQ